MTNEKFIQEIKKIYQEGVSLIEKKNADYATEADPWRNFKFAELVGVSVDRAILVRISDKIARISNLTEKEASVVDEKVEDTILDAINYLAILLAKRRMV